MSATPLFAGTAVQYGATIQSAETNRVTPTNYSTLVTGAGNGYSIPGLNIKATSTTTAGAIFFYLYDGSTYYLVHEELVTAVSPVAGTTATYEQTYVPDLPILVPLNWQLRVATLIAEQFKITTVNAAQF